MENRLLWILFVVLLGCQVLWFLRDVPAERQAEGDPAAIARLEARIDELESRLAASGQPLESALVDRAPAEDRIPPEVAAQLREMTDRLNAIQQRREVDAAAGRHRRKLVAQFNAAVARGDKAEMLRLLGSIDVNARDADKRTPLGAAAIKGDLESLKLLIAKGAELEKKGQRGMTPLVAALDADQEAAALYLLAQGADAEAPDKNGENPILWSSFNGLDDVTAKLLSMGVDADFRSNVGRTAVMDAARRGHLAIVRRLIGHGVRLDLRDEDGRSALDHAQKAGHTAIVKALRAAGAR